MVDSPFGFSSGPAATMGMAVRGAVNLLVKAGTAWDTHDDDRADRLLDRAAGLPFVRTESVWPGPYAAHLILFELLVHTAGTGEADEWFACVEATFAGLDDEGRTLLCDALAPVVQDWDLPPGLDRLIRGLIGDRANEHRWMDAGLDPATIRPGTEAVLRVALRLSHELEGRGLCSHLAPDGW